MLVIPRGIMYLSYVHVVLQFSIVLVVSTHPVIQTQNGESLARQYIDEFEKKYWPQAEQVQKFLMIDLKHLTNEDIQAGDLATFNIRNFTLEVCEKLKTLPVEGFQDSSLKRQINKIMKFKDWILEDKDLARKISFQPLINKVSKRPGICSYDNRTKCDLSYDGHLRELILKSDDPKEMEYYWVQWRDQLDNFVSIPFEEYMKIIRKSAKLNGFNITSDYWYDDYENGDVIKEMESLIRNMQPFYKQLHAYLRSILRKRYGTNIVSAKGPIPEHLLEKVWLQGFEHFTFYEDFENEMLFPIVSHKLVEKGYTGLKMIQESDRFYQSLGMPALNSTFWANNSRSLPESKSTLHCRPVVYDFGRVAGLKYCSKVDFRTFLEDHAIMAKIQFHMHVKNLPYGLNAEACPGLWKGIGKAVKLSTSSARHLREIGLGQAPADDEDDDMSINSLLHMAIHTVFKLPMYFVYEKIYADMLDQRVEPEEYNCEYWKLIEEWTGIEAPTRRDNDDFDVSKQFYKVTQSSMPLATKLISEFLGFHLYEIICTRIGQYNPRNPKMPLKECNFYNSTEAGKMFSDIMSQGWTKPCFDVIESVTRQRALTANAMLEYFRPLHVWLEQKNKANNESLGWIPSNKCQKDD